jgi:hypothetical protein
MSDSEGELPSEAAITQKLRNVVLSLHEAGNPDEITLKRVRARAEKELSLPDGFLKSSQWKEKCNDVIVAAAVRMRVLDRFGQDQSNEFQDALPVLTMDQLREVSAQKLKPKPRPVEKKTKSSEASTGMKRKATAPAKKAKKRRKSDSDDDMDMDTKLSELPADDLSGAESEPTKRKLVRRPAAKPAVEEESDDEATAAPANGADATPPPDTAGCASDSDMSELIDESPKPKSRQKKASAPKAKKDAKPAAKPKAADDPDTAEMKRLQGWLVKCGIRKVWSRDPELSSCNTSKEKINMLKRMLAEVGMDGKYSVEKAAKIKEQREFAKDLAAIQEAEAKWGTVGETSSGRPKRRAATAAKPLQKLVLSDDDEEEEQGGGDEDDESSADDGDDAEDDDVKGDSEDDDKNDSGAYDSD